MRAAILERWLDRPDKRVDAVKRVLEEMGDDPRLADRSTLERAALHPRYHEQALRTIARLKDPAYLGVLERILREQRDPERWAAAVSTVASYLSDAAAELLLVAASLAESEDARKFCLEQLESLRQFKLAKEHWASRRVTARTREMLVAELMGLLEDDDEEVRVQAVRGLVTFDAIEAIPRLIRLMKSSSKEVADEARKALEVLNERSAPDDG